MAKVSLLFKQDPWNLNGTILSSYIKQIPTLESSGRISARRSGGLWFYTARGWVTPNTLKMVFIATLCGAPHLKILSKVNNARIPFRVALYYAADLSVPILDHGQYIIEKEIGFSTMYVNYLSITVKSFVYYIKQTVYIFASRNVWLLIQRRDQTQMNLLHS